MDSNKEMGAPASAAIPIAASQADGCSGAEPFALLVLGDSMLPEFEEGDVVVIEPAGLAGDGAYVLAFHNAEWIFRQLLRRDDRWVLHALNPHYADQPLADLGPVRGVIIQKSKPGRRRAMKRYVE